MYMGAFDVSKMLFKCQRGHCFSTAACLHSKSLDICFLPLLLYVQKICQTHSIENLSKSRLIYVIRSRPRHSRSFIVFKCGRVGCFQINGITCFLIWDCDFLACFESEFNSVTLIIRKMGIIFLKMFFFFQTFCNTCICFELLKYIPR